MKKITCGAALPLVALAVVLLLAAGAGLFYLYQQRITQLTGITQTQTPMPTLTTTASPPPPSPTSATATGSGQSANQEAADLAAITQAMADKHNKTLTETDLTMNEYDGNYASGLVRFTGEIGGGWWLATKTTTGWIIAADGNGSVMCALIEPYNFPVSMVPECWDQDLMQLIQR